MLEQHEGKAIIWAPFGESIRRIAAKLQEEYPSLKRQVDERRRQRLQEQLPESSPNATPVGIPGLPEILKTLGR